jgi:hypothetical protein
MNMDLNSMSGSSFRNPVPPGVTIKTKIERGDPYSAPEVYDIEATVIKILRGEGARKLLREQNIITDQPKENFEYILVDINVRYSRRGRGFVEEPFQLDEERFVATSADGETEYEIPFVLQQPQPQLLNIPLQPGETHQGWILLQVPETEKKPLLIFKRENVEVVYGVWGNVWFQLY